MKEHRGFLFKVIFTGDSITPVYEIRMYRPRKWWFPELLWIETVHRDNIISAGQLFDSVIAGYNMEQQRWADL